MPATSSWSTDRDLLEAVRVASSGENMTISAWLSQAAREKLAKAKAAAKRKGGRT